MGRKKRRTFTGQMKFEIVIEALRGEKSAAQICRDRDISENLLSRWKQELLTNGAEVFEKASQGKGSEQDERIAELERLVGRQALELEILKKAGVLLGLTSNGNGR
jgi:transposase-like protein